MVEDLECEDVDARIRGDEDVEAGIVPVPDVEDGGEGDGGVDSDVVCAYSLGQERHPLTCTVLLLSLVCSSIVIIIMVVLTGTIISICPNRLKAPQS